MKILIIAILTLIFANRIICTPKALNKKGILARYKNARKQFNNANHLFSSREGHKSVIINISLFFDLITVIFYTILGCIWNNPVFGILSMLQVLTCIVGMFHSIRDYDMIFGDAEFPTPKLGFNIFNVVLDYVYYPYAIYLILI